MEERIFYPNSASQKMCGILSNNSANTNVPLVILVHGFSSSKNTQSWSNLVELLNNEGIAVFRIDLFAHGESEGNFADLTTSKAVDGVHHAIEYVKELGYQKIGLLGSSFGGLSSLMTASQRDDLQFLGLKSPVSDYESELLLKLGEKKILTWKTQGQTKLKDGDKYFDMNYTSFEDAKNNRPYEVVNKIKIPILIVHGDHDTEVPIDQSRKLVKLLPNAKLVEVSGADHGYKKPGERKEMVEVFYQFIMDHAYRSNEVRTIVT